MRCKIRRRQVAQTVCGKARGATQATVREAYRITYQQRACNRSPAGNADTQLPALERLDLTHRARTYTIE
jgi:hypothetical protein